MALALKSSPFHDSITIAAGKRRHAFRRSSFLPLTTPSTKKKKKKLTASPSPQLRSSSSVKTVRRQPLDNRDSAKISRLRFVSKLQTLLLSKPHTFLPLGALSHGRCIPPPAVRSFFSSILRYPAVFRLFRSNSRQSLSLYAVALTPAAAEIGSRAAALRSSIASSLSSKLHRLVMLSRRRSLILSKLAYLAPDLGLPPDFRSRLCNHHPGRFRIVETSYGRALELVSWDPLLAFPLPAFDRRTPNGGDFRDRPIVDRPPKFKQLKLRPGLNLKRRHRDYLLRLQELPEVPLYSEFRPERASVEEAEKRACAAVREVLGLTVKKKTQVDHLSLFRSDFHLPTRLRAMLLRHPEMFHVTTYGPRDSVFLMEAYGGKRELLVEDELLELKEGLQELVREGRRMRRERRRGFRYGDDDEESEEEDGDGMAEEEDDDDGLGGLFNYGIGFNLEEFIDVVDDDDIDVEEEVMWEEVDDLWIANLAEGKLDVISGVSHEV